jgi:hypothetical protein
VGEWTNVYWEPVTYGGLDVGGGYTVETIDLLKGPDFVSNLVSNYPNILSAGFWVPDVDPGSDYNIRIVLKNALFDLFPQYPERFIGFSEYFSITRPTSTDRDGDGLPDDIDPCPDDADCDDDGLLDGPGGSEDLNANGIVDPGETDPLNPDTDGDGIFDGTERGLTEPETSDTDLSAGNFIPDADPSTTTDPTNPDTDGDGLSDGEEDANQNGRVDAGETSPIVSDVTTADLDGNGIVDFSDYQVFRSTLGKCSSDTGFLPEADYDEDGCITYADYRTWYGYYRNQ